jgi:cyclomaltodextrinase
VTPAPPAWVSDAVFYQIFPDRFARSGRVPAPGPLEDWDTPPTTHGFKGGDLYGIADRLDYLADLGITALYLNPIVASAANHRYHAYDYLHVDPLLGGDDAFAALIDAAHARGMRVILDGVFNHSGRGFWPFHHVLENGAASPYREWFYFEEGALARNAIRGYPSRSEFVALGSARRRAEWPGAASREVLGYSAWWDLPALPKLNVGHPPVREYLLGVAQHWIDRGADGWRLDVPEEITDDDFWREFRERVRARDAEAYIVAEIWHVAPWRLAGDQFDATMNYPLGEAILGFAAGSHLDTRVIAAHGTYSQAVQRLDGPTFGARLDELLSAYDPATVEAELNLVGSHDLPRFVTMAGGDRDALRLASLVQMTLPGAPCVYYGDEIGLEGAMDPGCRGAFPWEPERWDHDLRGVIQRSIAARHAHDALRHGGFRVVAAEGGALAYLRHDENEILVVALNAGERDVELQAAIAEAAGRPLSPVLETAGPGGATALRVGDDGEVAIPLRRRAGTLFVAE